NVGCIRVVRLGFHAVLVNLSMESLANLAGGAGKLDVAFALGDFRNAESVGAEPGCGYLNVRIGWSKLLAKLFGREPLVITRRPFGMRAGQELLQGGLAFRWPVQNQEHSLGRQGIGRW